LVDVAIQAGFEKEKIFTSDIGLFSSLIGYYLSGKEVESLNYDLVSEEHRTEYRGLDSIEKKIAFLMWVMKCAQIRKDVYYEQLFLRHLIHSRAKIIDELSKKLVNMKSRMSGINYEIKDIRQIVGSGQNDRTVVIIHPPAYANGYKKMFDLTGVVRWDNNIEQFDFKKEFMTIYNMSKERPETYIWSCYESAEGIPTEEVFFAEERSKNKYEFFCVTKPERLKDSAIKYSIHQKKMTHCKPLPIPIVEKDFRITKETKIQVVCVKEEVALYYRDLWAHKMGTTKAEQYYLFLLDGKAFGVTGFQLSKALRLVSEDVFEVFGFDQPLDHHPNSHKLFMMLLTCNDMRRILINSTSRNRIFDIKGFRTVCITKYRSLKSSAGLLNIMNREKMPNGNYKILYHTLFYKRTFEETLAEWCDKEDKLVYSKREEVEQDA